MVWHLPLMNSFNKTKASIFPMQACFPRRFPFSQINSAFNFTIPNLVFDVIYSINLKLSSQVHEIFVNYNCHI